MPSKIYWTKQAKDDLRAIRDFIARDAPSVSVIYTRRLRSSVGRLREFPYSGQVVAEVGREDIREILHGNYRIIYRVGKGRVDVLTIYHGARLLKDFSFLDQ